jgi:hypothetical protein
VGAITLRAVTADCSMKSNQNRLGIGGHERLFKNVDALEIARRTFDDVRRLNINLALFGLSGA